MYPWTCCRTCLGLESLNPIFPEFGKKHKYSEAVFAATGLMVDPNDYLPQQMCSTCIAFINESKEFRKKAIESHKELLKRLQSCSNDNKLVLEYEPEKKPLKIEIVSENPININDDWNDKFSDDDDIPLDHFKSVKKFEADSSDDHKQITVKSNGENKLNSTQDSVLNAPDIVNEGNKVGETTEKKTVKRKPRSKKTDKEDKSTVKTERVKERIECEYCHKILTSKLSVRNHYKIHTGFDVVCEHCGKKFITRRLLLMHCRAKHGYEKVDKCSYCDYRGSNAEQVKIHERLHTGEKPYKCGECDDAFHRKSSYLQHIATHLKEKTVQCTECPSRFKSVTLMRIHRARHKPSQHAFRCELCGKSFARRRNAARHVYRAHRAQGHVARYKNNCGIST
ncbi:zinc finger protein 700-like [Ostrinia furnacalis]|uniref:zinc finger protein 700-like n=1 Tax=Ostrinia furnacalis TaxID=93504 RepID=UPI00103C9B00|nr:zinc finger protein 700-like [Ostrinia furnacalis]